MDISEIKDVLLLARGKIQNHLNEIYDAGGVEYIGLGSTLNKIDSIVKLINENPISNYEKLRELFVEYVSKAQDGFHTGRKEISILYDYEEITGRDFVKDREEFRGKNVENV